MDIYLAITVSSTDEVLMALLTQYEFESFEEYDDHFIAYIPKKYWDEEAQSNVISIISKYTDQFTIEDVAPQNWNAIWEASFQPVIVDDFCQIRAEFHPPLKHIKYDLVINPKMAFGTGHHATTHSMIAEMASIDFEHKSVFDFGCGTGILAILASKLGATHIDAIDIEHESYLNTLENSSINQVSNIHVYEGDLDAAPTIMYDIILANINRNILIKYANDLIDSLADHGVLLLSGVLVEDKEIVIKTYLAAGMILVSDRTLDGWICAHLRKNSLS